MEAVPPSPHRAITLGTPTAVRPSSLMRRTNIRLRQLVLEALTWSKTSRGEARLMGCPLGLEQRTVRGSDGRSD
jgi:hypothetical protein